VAGEGGKMVTEINFGFDRFEGVVYVVEEENLRTLKHECSQDGDDPNRWDDHISIAGEGDGLLIAIASHRLDLEAGGRSAGAVTDLEFIASALFRAGREYERRRISDIDPRFCQGCGQDQWKEGLCTNGGCYPPPPLPED
jgi:hypothetical protein